VVLQIKRMGGFPDFIRVHQRRSDGTWHTFRLSMVGLRMIRCRPFCSLLVLTLGRLVCLRVSAAPGESSPKAESSSATAAAQPAGNVTTSATFEPALTPDQLYDLGKGLFDQYAPAEVKEQYEFPTKAQWDEFAAKLQGALAADSMENLVGYESQARAALGALRMLPGYEDYAEWLQERLDMIEAARVAAQLTQPGKQPVPPLVPGRPAPPELAMPFYDLWRERLRGRAAPANAAALMPVLQAGFSAEGVPPELAWMAEVESSLNANARSPSGAKGLFQLMPETAKGLGLSTWLPDDRTDPAKSARAAAQLLKNLHARFGDWPLALAAYNAGEGRVGRALAAKQATTFAEISPSLSVETRLYVPKIYATIALRTGVSPERLAEEPPGATNRTD
jgi:membrane-bound lytic murein transglycosylase D